MGVLTRILIKGASCILCIVAKWIDRYYFNEKQLWKGDYNKYASFKNTELSVRLGMLYLNNLIKINEKYKVLEGVKVLDVVVKEDKRFYLRDYLLEVKVENRKLFTVVE